MRTGFEEVHQRDGGPVFGKKPDAGSLHLQQMAAGLGDGLEGVKKFAAVQSFTLGQLPERFLIPFKQ
jgi:hypothetical protein